MARRTLLYLLICLTFLTSCERPAATYQFERYTLGTYVQLEVFAKRKNAKAFIKEFDQLSEQDTKDLYAWGNGWLVGQNNFLQNAQCGLPVDGDTLLFFKRLKQLHQQSSGLFDPSIMPLVELWGFHKAEEMRSRPPTDEDIDHIRMTYGNMHDLDVRAKTICSTRPIKVDLGGIAKGWVAEKTRRLLDENNIKNAMIGFGGDLIAVGQKADGSAWKVGLKNPDIKREGFDAPAVFEISHSSDKVTAIFTSGDYERQFEHAGKRSHHILDPRTGYPNTAVRSVTVIHHDPVLADAAATALHVAGEDWQNIATQMGLDKVLVLFPNKEAQISPAMAAITSWLDNEYEVEVVAHADLSQ